MFEQDHEVEVDRCVGHRPSSADGYRTLRRDEPLVQKQQQLLSIQIKFEIEMSFSHRILIVRQMKDKEYMPWT